MARNIDPNSVSSKVSKMKLDESLVFKNPYTSIAVMVSHLRKKEEHDKKIFKISYSNEHTTVTRVK